MIHGTGRRARRAVERAHHDIAPILRRRHHAPNEAIRQASPTCSANAPNSSLMTTNMAKTLFRLLLAALFAASPIAPAAFAANAQQETDDEAPSDTLRQFKKATVAIGRPTEGAPAFAGHDSMEIVSSGFLYAYTPIELARGRSKPDDDGNVYYWAQIWVITCRHCIEELEHPIVRINSKTHGTITYSVPKQFWHFHPTEDVAAAPFPSQYGEDPAKQGLSRIEDSDFQSLSRNTVALRAQLARLGFFEYTPVAIIGFQSA